MVTIYLCVLWLFYTMAWRSIQSVRGSGLAFVVWCGLTAVVLWPLTREGIEFFNTNSAIQATIQETRRELDADFRKEFPEFYTEKEKNNEGTGSTVESGKKSSSSPAPLDAPSH